MPECRFDYRRSERPFVHAVAKSPDDFFQVFGNNEVTVSPLTARISKGNFSLDQDDYTYCKVPKTGIYVVLLQVNVRQILATTSSSTTHVIGVGKVSDTTHTVKEFVVATTYLPVTFAGSAFCANLTALVENELLFVKLDSRIKIAFDEETLPIQLIAYMVSPKVN